MLSSIIDVDDDYDDGYDDDDKYNDENHDDRSNVEVRRVIDIEDDDYW